MKQIWAPWRMEYITADKSGDCIFCTLPQANEDEENLILLKTSHCFVIMNRFPYNNGHIMVAPYRHQGCISQLDETEWMQVNRIAQKSVEAIRSVIAPDGFNMGINLGKAAGAGYDEHVHLHILPRWTGDTNFMPTLAETKVHPQHLRATYEKFLPYFQNLNL